MILEVIYWVITPIMWVVVTIILSHNDGKVRLSEVWLGMVSALAWPLTLAWIIVWAISQSIITKLNKNSQF